MASHLTRRARHHTRIGFRRLDVGGFRCRLSPATCGKSCPHCPSPPNGISLLTLTITTPPATTASVSPAPFHGWRMVGYAAVALAMTAPGQTIAVSALIDPMITDLGVSRSAISTAYLIGTLTGAAALPGIGRLIDRYGTRYTMAVIAAVFGTVLIGLSFVSGIVGLTVGFVGIRMAGQGALTIAATNLAARWFQRRRGTALSIVSAFGGAGISLAPIVLERLVAAEGWRTAWAAQGVAVWLIVIPIAVWGVRNRPADIGQHIDGKPATTANAGGHHDRYTLRQTLHTGFFWVLAAAVSTSGMLTTAVAFHQISLLTERGLSTTAAAANFLPQTIAGLAATLAVGTLVDRRNPRLLLVISMAALAAGLVWATTVTPGWSALGFGVTIGAAAAAIRCVEAATTPRLFGTTHLGAIRGTITAVNVASTAFGPLAFALIHQSTGTYTAALAAGTLLPIAVIVATLTTRPPALRPQPATSR